MNLSLEDNVVTAHIDLKRVLETARVGVRRAHTFMAVGLQAVESGPPATATLRSSVQFRFLPDPLPEELASSIAREYETWLVGAGLRELDHWFGLFLDQVWQVISVGDLHGGTIKSDHVIGGKFPAETNVGRKLGQVCDRLGTRGVEQEYFKGFSLARNSLAHAAGIVRAREAREDGQLRLKWLGFDTLISQNGIEELFAFDAPSFEVTDPDGAQLYTKVVERERTFNIGDQIRLTPNELSEICFFYDLKARQVVVLLSEWLRALGL